MIEPMTSWESWLFSKIKHLLSRIGVDFLIQISILLLFYISVTYGFSLMVPRLEPSTLLQPVFIGLLASWLLAASRLRTGTAWVILVSCGLSLTTGSLANLGLPAVRIFWFSNMQAMAQTFLRLGTIPAHDFTATVNQAATTSQFRSVLDLASLKQYFEALLDFWGNLSALLVRSEAWLTNLIEGRSLVGSATFDPLVSSLVWGMVFWLLAAWSSWCVCHWNRPILAVLPASIILSTTMAYTRIGTVSLLGVISTVLLLLAWNSFSKRLKRWELDRIDYAEDLRLDVNVTAAVLTVGFVFLAAMAPVLSIKKIGEVIDRFRPSLTTSNPRAAESLGLEVIPPTPAPSSSQVRKIQTDINGTGLPRHHLLGAGPELSETLVMTVKVSNTGNDPPRLPMELEKMYSGITIEIPRYYWRAVTYDVYNGHGWETSLTESTPYPPGEATHPGLILFPDEGREPLVHPFYRRPGIQLVNQAVTPAADFDGLVLASGELLGVKERYRVLWRKPPDPARGSEGDQFAAVNMDTPGPYLAWSAVTRPSEDLMDPDPQQPSVDEYPDWVLDRYLQLPEDLPNRVIQIANEITEGKNTPYKRVAAIQAYLRTIPYTLDLPEPPADQDVVDYFLFDIKQGYCDYAASAMVVMARAVGVPARLAIGYASGTYDIEKGVYLVSEANGHSWPEIYFPEVGWVEFEPTSGLPEIERLEGDRLDSGEIPPSLSLDQPPPPLNLKSWGIIGTAVMLVLLLLMAMWVVSEGSRLLHQPPVKAILGVFHRLYNWSLRSGHGPGPGETPNEFASRLTGTLSQLWRLGDRDRWFGQVQKSIRRIASAYSYTIYSNHTPTKEDRRQVLDSWNQLRWRLYILRLLHLRKVEK